MIARLLLVVRCNASESSTRPTHPPPINKARPGIEYQHHLNPYTPFLKHGFRGYSPPYGARKKRQERGRNRKPSIPPKKTSRGAHALKICRDELSPIAHALKTCADELPPLAQALETCADELSPIARALKTWADELPPIAHLGGI